MRVYHFIFLFFLSLVASAQDYFPVVKDGKWGAIDKTGKVIIPFTYKHLSSFNIQNLAIAETENGKGVINHLGNEILPFSFQKVQTLSNGQAIVWENFKVGVVTLENKEIIKPSFDAITFETEGIYRLLKDGKFGLSKSDGEIILPTEYLSIESLGQKNIARINKENKYGLVNSLGELIAEPKYDKILFEEDLILGHIGNARTRFILDDKGELLETNEFVNQKAFELAQKKILAKVLAEKAKTNPDIKKLRWMKKGGVFTLENALGSNVLSGKQFYWVNEDEKTALSMAKTVDHEGTEELFLIDGNAGKILFKKKDLIDFVVTDFAESNWARCADDTTWDAVISKEGELVKAFQVEGKELRIKDIGEYRERKAWIKFSNDKYGFLDENADILIQPTFERAGDFYKGLAVFRNDKKFGVINAKGEVVVKPTYVSISNLEDGLFRVKNEDGLWGAINSKGQNIIPFKYNEMGSFKNGKAYVIEDGLFGLVNNKGHLLFSPQIDCDFMGEFKNGIAPIYKGKYTINRGKEPVVRYRTQGFIKENGQILVEPVYSSINKFEEIWAAKRGIARIVKGRSIGYINYNGNIVLDAIYERVENYEEVWAENRGLARVKKDGLIGFVDYNGNEVLPIRYQGVTEDFKQVWKAQSGLAKAKMNDRYGFLNYKGDVVIPFAYTSVSDPKGGIIIVEQDGKWGAVDEQNKEILPIKYSGVKFIENTKPQLLKVYTDADATYRLNAQGMLEPTNVSSEELAEGGLSLGSGKYKIVRDYDQNGLAVGEITKKGRKWQALINEDGKATTKFLYKRIGEFSEGLAYVQIQSDKSSERKYGFINLEGEQVIPCTFKNAQNFSDGLAAIMQRGKWGYIDNTGKVILQAQFNNAMAFSDGFAVVNEKEIIDRKGEKVGSLISEGEISSSFKENRAVVTLANGLQYHILPTGKAIYKAKFDEVTDFYGDFAFAKKGEMWQITRQRDKKETYRVQMTKKKYGEYINKFGKTRSIKTADGHVLKDIKFEKVEEGTWRLMTKDGAYPNDATFNELGQDDEGFWVKLNRFTGVVNGQGEFLVKPECEIVKRVSEDVIRVENQGKVKYMSTSGEWIWNE
ncbi:WG repeat-containing protein [Sediminitomix flava]|uniref:WG repeat protein n=1 Tax=Sediminitomix flava TaxID=379075 RepID=A0A315Z913_SEDFL|nr:WG repeat-containing protein [Sediminitomix flava]PWJ41880.1 WG repeat protein [Sediminitomix flava]